MLDLIKEGIKLNQSLALLPFKAARRLLDDKNTGAKQFVDLAEDMVSTPFVAAAKVIDSAQKPCAVNGSCDKNNGPHGGPTINNVWVNPEVTVFSDVQAEPGKRRAILVVTGLLCGG